jgi:type IV pilus assembly protein PilW
MRALAEIPKIKLRRHAAGLSLVELMVAMVIGFLILAAMLSAYSSGSSTTAANARFVEMQTNGRYAIDFMRREIQHAGFLGITYSGLSSDASAAATDALCGGSIAVTNIAQRIWGANDAKSLSCIDDADYARGDVLVLRRMALTQIPTAGCPVTGATNQTLSSTKAYVRTQFKQATAFVGATAPWTTGDLCEDYALEVDIYYVSPYTNVAGDGVPALKRLTLGAGPAFTSQVVATGIENMQIQYGVVGAGSVIFLDANAVAATDWPNVVSVRLWLLARSSDPQYEGYKDTSSYAIGDLGTGSVAAYTVNDNYVRQIFPLTVQLRK